MFCAVLYCTVLYCTVLYCLGWTGNTSVWLLQVPVTFIYGEHDWMNPAAGVAVAEILDRIRERKVGASANSVKSSII
jgi:hypothetical protein